MYHTLFGIDPKYRGCLFLSDNLNLTPRTHVGVNEFKAVKMLPVNYRVDQLKLNLMFNINHGMAPSYFFSPRVRDQHSIATRSREYGVVVPRVRGPGSSTFAFTAAKLWNELPAIYA